MRINVAHLVMTVFCQERLQVGAGMDPAIPLPQRILATPREDDFMLEGALLTAAQGEQHTIASSKAGSLGREEMPELCGRHARLRFDRELHCDAVTFEDLQRCDATVQRQDWLGTDQATVQQDDGEGQDDAERFETPTDGTEQDADQQQAEIVVVLCRVAPLQGHYSALGTGVRSRTSRTICSAWTPRTQSSGFNSKRCARAA